MRAGDISCGFARAGPPASLSSGVELNPAGMIVLLKSLTYSAAGTVFAILLLLREPSPAQDIIEAVSPQTPNVLPLEGYANSGVGWSFVPNTDLVVAAIATLAPEHFTPATVNFWQGTNQIIATFTYTATTLGGVPTNYQLISPLVLSAGQTYSVSAWSAGPDFPTTLFTFWGRNEIADLPPFNTSPHINYLAGYYVSTNNLWSPLTTPPSLTMDVLALGPNFRFFFRPSIQARAEAGGGLTLAWNAVPGSNYQVQYKTRWDQIGWSNLGGPAVATNGTMTVADSIAPGTSQRWYRVVLTP
jgi:hypothetical protein